MFKIYLLIFFISIFILSPVKSQVNLDWAACYNGPANDMDVAQAICVDDSGNVYVTGASRGTSSNFDYVTIKYDPGGNQLWVNRYDQNNQFEVAHSIIVNDSGYVYVTGGIYTLKYSNAGNLIWVVNNDAECFRIIENGNGDVYVGGSAYENYRIIKISKDGKIIWSRDYDGTAISRDSFRDMVLDSDGNLIVTGWSHGTGTHWDYATIKYSPAGDSLWVRRYNGPSTLFPGDYAYAVTVDDEDNIYVTGLSDGSDSINNDAQCLTIAYSPEGDILWESRYAGRGYAGYDVIYSGGYIYVVASSYNQGVDLLKYDKQGNLIWANNFLPFGSPVHPPQLVSDNEGFIYISSVKNLNYAALKISPGGAKIWEFLYPDSANPGSFVRAMTIDKRKNIYLTGESIGWVCPGDNYDYLTVKISQDKVGINPNSNIISDYRLFQNYPNPFNPSTTIKFTISKKEFVVLKIFDQLGRDVKTLLSKEIPEGTHSVILNAELLSAGIYFYRLTAGEFIQTRKLLLMK